MVQESSSCTCNRPKSIHVGVVLSNAFLVLTLGLLNLPFGISHIASVIEADGVPGIPIKSATRGPTVAPYPSPDTLDQFVQRNRGDDEADSFFNPTQAIKNLLANRVHGLKRVSQFHENVGGGGSGSTGHYGLLGGVGLGKYYQSPHQNTWDSDEDGVLEQDEEDDEGKPTFVPFIGARALTNIPQFFEHLKENIAALKMSPDNEDSDIDSDDNSSEDDNQETDLYRRLSKPAARRTKTELLVDENRGRSSPNSRQSDSSTLKQSWKPRAAGIVHYYSPKSNFLESHQNMLRRANNYNPAWLYTNLGLGKRRRR
ncbi:unnamed protein product [Orchesella dallaii]|uniref:Uncharacterized protein n=1 Tax=Orchesella dallaii TaxID=48710 RepID=A0ABP1Q889_9HEXA